MYCILIKNQKKHVFYKYLSLEAIEKGHSACYTSYKENCLTISLHILIPDRRKPGNHIAKEYIEKTIYKSQSEKG